MSSKLPPVGWGVLELAESDAQKALDEWKQAGHSGSSLYLDRTVAMAVALGRLLDELDAERKAKRP